jgi:uncharacterized membrane protein
MYLPLLAFTILYVLGDMCYVALSKSVYVAAVRAIQGSGVVTPARPGAALAAYACLALGFVAFVAPTALRMAALMPTSPALAGAAAGATFGFVTYGVFNFTMRAMFSRWNPIVMARDVLWGTAWAATVAAGFCVSVMKPR